MKPNSTWYANSQRIRILMMSVISGHERKNEQVVTMLMKSGLSNVLFSYIVQSCQQYCPLLLYPIQGQQYYSIQYENCGQQNIVYPCIFVVYPTVYPNHLPTL